MTTGAPEPALGLSKRLNFREFLPGGERVSKNSSAERSSSDNEWDLDGKTPETGFSSGDPRFVAGVVSFASTLLGWSARHLRAAVDGIGLQVRNGPGKPASIGHCNYKHSTPVRYGVDEVARQEC